LIRRQRTNIDSDDDTDDEKEPQVSKSVVIDSSVSSEPVLIKMSVALDGKEPASQQDDEFLELDENHNTSNNLDVSAELEQLSIKKRKVEVETDSTSKVEADPKTGSKTTNKRKGR
jgi:hypothetical protein